jgi:glycosyltransferase involved in cell wall biosynthesis
MTPKVSIGIPAYKTAFLEEAMASVMAQTFQDWELIVVDDCSPGDVRGIVERFSDPRIRYYRNEQNLGAEDPSYNWDRCLSSARGEYFCLLCDDDLYHPTFLEEMLKLAEQFPDCHVFRARAEKIDAHGDYMEKYPSSPLWESCEDYIWHRTQGMRHQTISEWMLRKQRMSDCGGYVHYPCAWGGDVESIYRFCVEGGIASSYQTLVTFRRSGQNISMHPEQDLIPKLDALLLEKEQTTDLIRDYKMNPALIELVKKKQESESRFLLEHVPLAEYLRVAFFKRKKYGLRLKTLMVDLLRRMLIVK